MPGKKSQTRTWCIGKVFVMKRIGSMPVYGCRALCKSQYAVSTPPPAHRGCSAPQTRARGEVDVFHKPRHGFATEPMNFGVGGCHCSASPAFSVYNEWAGIRLKSRKGCPGRSRAFSLRIIYKMDNVMQ